MRHVCTFALLGCCALLLAYPAAAQRLWERQYQLPNSESLTGLLALRDGGYLLSGSVANSSSSFVAPALLWMRTNAQGDTLWIKKQAIRRYTNVRGSALLCEDANGRTLLAAHTYSMSSIPFLVLLNAAGDTL